MLADRLERADAVIVLTFVGGVPAVSLSPLSPVLVCPPPPAHGIVTHA